MEPYPLYPHTFSRALPYINHNQSVAIYLDLRGAGYIDEQGFGKLPQAVNLTEWYVAEPIPSCSGSWSMHFLCHGLAGPASWHHQWKATQDDSPS